MDCIICWEPIFTQDADTFCSRGSHGMCAPCFFYMRKLKKDQCPLCRGREGGSRSILTQRLDAVVEAVAAVEEKEAYLRRLREGICESIGRLILSLYLCITVFMVGVAFHVAVTIRF